MVSLTAADVNRNLAPIAPGPLHVKTLVNLGKNDLLTIRYQGRSLAAIQPEDTEDGQGSMQLEILIDRCVAEIFVNGGMRYIIRELPPITNSQGLAFDLGQNEGTFTSLEVYEMKSMWRPA